MSRPRSAYREDRKVGEGAYGSVFLAYDKVSGKKVALKRIDLVDKSGENGGVTITTLREITHLFKVRHENVVDLVEVVYGGQNLNDCNEILMVLEFLDHDLQAIQQRVKSSPTKMFPIGDVKTYMVQLLKGLSAIHQRGILHRDLKSANLLVSSDGVLKIADFGLSRLSAKLGQAQEELTPQVCTLWYRPPELLLAGKSRMRYGPEVDIWSAGCIFAELLCGTPLFGKENEIDALYEICRICGSPNPEHWPEVVRLPGWESCRKDFPHNKLRQSLLSRICERRKNMSKEDRAACEEAVDQLVPMLSVTPSLRPTAAEVYSKDFFNGSLPLPTPRAKLACLGVATDPAAADRQPAGGRGYGRGGYGARGHAYQIYAAGGAPHVVGGPAPRGRGAGSMGRGGYDPRGGGAGQGQWHAGGGRQSGAGQGQAAGRQDAGRQGWSWMEERMARKKASMAHARGGGRGGGRGGAGRGAPPSKPGGAG